MAGHSVITATWKRLSQYFYWPGLLQEVTEYIKHCDLYQKAKSRNTYPAGLLQPLPIPTKIWADISIDFITHLPTSKSYTTILVMVDRFSKGAHFAPLSAHYTAPLVAQAYCDYCGKLHGLPETVVSDRDSIFLSQFWSTFFRQNGTKLRFSSTYHPQTDGQTERVNRCINQYLRIFAFQHPRHWAQLLSWAEYHYNTTFHASAGMTPFEAVFGRPPPCFIPAIIGGPGTAIIPDRQHRERILKRLHINLTKAQAKMKRFADRKQREVVFAEGDSVLLRLHPYRQATLHPQKIKRFRLQYYGPFTILERIGEVAYRLDLPSDCKIHLVFHVSLLKRYYYSTTPTTQTLPTHKSRGRPISHPIAILDLRHSTTENEEQALVQWDGQLPEEATWIKLSQLDPDTVSKLRQPGDNQQYRDALTTPINVIPSDSTADNINKTSLFADAGKEPGHKSQHNNSKTWPDRDDTDSILSHVIQTRTQNTISNNKLFTDMPD
ncbi:hypothetical protein KSP39_PZI021756 [Platanthera zijinensis]|uniref:Integrase catalytic domain-containing protein n=1 Tax=Platanthera zijinensis TaxID=2320716 RepID=A0AAP0AYH4_9ASPA